MKFQKVLIGTYLVIQILITVYLISNHTSWLAYGIWSILTLAFFVLTRLRDPGYLLIDVTRPQLQEEIEEDEEMAAKNEQSTTKSKCRFCRICMINQPFRTKHCHECEKCVATFDHHCPWMGTCIGEKNRPFFLLFLICQTIQCFLAALYICTVAINKITPVPSELILGMTLILLLAIVFGLTGFQLYLMVVNLTTWEFAKWDKIEYLSKLSRNSGSPFSKGVARNIIQFWVLGFRGARKMWEFESD